jgi:4-aminobutyrate aminotransferase-like enzyme
MDLLQHTPSLTRDAASAIARDLYGLHADASPLPGERDQNFLLRTHAGNTFVLKIANAADSRSLLEAQSAALAHVARRTTLCPTVVPGTDGSTLSEWTSDAGIRHVVRLLTWIPGVTLGSLPRQSLTLLEDLGRKVGALDVALDGFDHPAAHRDLYWDLANGPRVIREHAPQIGEEELRTLVLRLARRIEEQDSPLFSRLRRAVVHNDPNDYNVVVAARDQSGDPDYEVVGILDFGDMVHTFAIADLAIAIAYAVLDTPDPVAAACRVVRGYHTVRALHANEVDALFALVLLRLCASVSIAAWQQAQRPGDEYLSISQASIRRTLPILADISPAEAQTAFRDAMSGSPEQADHKARLREKRKAVIGRNVRVGYRDPVNIVRGWMQYLYDETGRQYLDAYNNVPHVGHCHPRVVEAAAEQNRLLNTNTRYLHDTLVRYAERLIETLPDPLRVCYFVNSGSEANELALRLARAHTKQKGIVVLDAAYHGNTTTLVSISPYKFDGPGGEGRPSWVRTVPIPDVYRGPIKTAPDAGARYGAFVADAANDLTSHDSGVAAFIAESAPSVGGQIILPADYLQTAYGAVRKAGGVCIADEVQTALGRLGDCFYAFEPQHVVPDIVVLGKPIGNGHPIGAVVTTPAIAESFDNGMEFFSTFGGSTVSCAVGLAVLDVVRDEGLQDHARDVGSALLERLRALGSKHSIVGDIRGSGLFIGVELVKSRERREPATTEAGLVVNRMRDDGILLGTDGPFANVLKIRPPMPFTRADAELLAETLDRVLAGL